MRKTFFIALLQTAAAVAFDSGGWKKDENGNLVVDGSGNPILLTGDGKEMSVKQTTVLDLQNENKTMRTRAETAETALKPFEGLDAAAARDAITKLKDVDLSKMIEKGELDRVKNEITSQFTQQLTEKETALSSTMERVNSLLLDQAFSRSKYIEENIAIPRDMFEANFGKHFKIEDGKPVAYDASGNRLMSKKSVGELATVDEAFELLVDNYPHKNSILKAPEQRGSGGSNGGNRGGGRVITRAAFDALTPTEQASVAAQAGKGEVQIV